MTTHDRGIADRKLQELLEHGMIGHAFDDWDRVEVRHKAACALVGNRLEGVCNCDAEIYLDGERIHFLNGVQLR